MKTEYEKGLNQVCLHIDLPRIYEEDYRIHMLRENQIPGLLKVTGCGVDGKSRYSYDVTGMMSMKAKFQTSAIKKADMLLFANRLMEVVKTVRRYMLNPDGLLLYPEFMFYGEENWHFCYLPGKKKALCEAFHVVTEYFVKKLDYEETAGIILAYELHKATLQDNYDLEKVLNEYRQHEEERGEREGRSVERKVTEGKEYGMGENLFSLEEEEYEVTRDVETLRETGGKWNPWKRSASKLKKGKWGSWKDLILETDGQKEENPL